MVLVVCQSSELGLAVVDLAKDPLMRGSLARSTTPKSSVNTALLLQQVFCERKGAIPPVGWRTKYTGRLAPFRYNPKSMP
jgi:hypothetical protein